MCFVVFMALLSSLMWLQLMITDYINIKYNAYTARTENETKLIPMLKIGLIFLMAIFWAVAIRYFN